MNNPIFQTICRVGIFMICAQAVVHFRPNAAYEKYLKFLVGIMVLAQLFQPLGVFLSGGGKQDLASALEQFEKSLEESAREAGQRAGEADAALERMTLEEVRRRAAESDGSLFGDPGGEGQPDEGQTGEAREEPEEKEGGEKPDEIRIRLEGIAPVEIGP